MRFNKNHLVDIKSLTESEARIFIRFLWLERKRHIKAADRCSVWDMLWNSEIMRQLEEVEHIDGGIEEVNKKFGWEEK